MRRTFLIGLSIFVAACSGTATGTGTGTSGSSGSKSGGAVDSPGPSESGGDGTSGTSGTKGTSCSASKGRCSCYSSSSPNDVRCSTTLLTGALCCADPGWPSQGGCSCELPCYGARNSCSCGSVGGESATCDGDVCCKTDTECRCESSSFGTSCSSGTRVASCTGFKPTCTGGATSVTSCSSSP